MKRKSFVIIAAVLIFAFVISGCGGTGTQKPEGATGPEVSTKTTEGNFNKTGYPIVNDSITLTCMHSQNPLHGIWGEMSYFKKMEEVTNIKMDFISVPASDWPTRKNLTLASGDLPNWFFSGLTVDDLQRYGVEGGMFIDISDMTKEYMPNLEKDFALYPMAKNIIKMLDGSIYCLPYIVDDATCAGDTLYVRMDLLKKAGVDKKPDTVEDFYNMLVAFKDAGFASDFSPLLPSGGLGAVENFLFPSFGDGFDPGFADNGDGKVVYNVISDQYYRYLEFANKLFTEKLLEPEVFTMDWATATAKVKEDLGGVITAGTSLTLDNFESGTYEVELFPPLLSEYTSERKLRRYNTVSMSGGTITNKTKDEDVLALLRWMDINYSDEEIVPGLSRFTQWMGIRGESWDFVGDNDEYFVMIVPEDTEMAEFEWIMKHAAPGGSIADFRTDAIPYGTPSQEMKAVQSLENLYPYMIDPFPDSFLKYDAKGQEVLANKVTDILTYVDQMKARFITGNEPLSNWDNFVAEVEKMGIEEILAIKQTAYDIFLGK